MSAVSDILALLDRWPGWKAITALPGKVAELEARVAKLEGTKSKPGGVTMACPMCGEAMKLAKVTPDELFGNMGVQQREFVCSCGHNERRIFDPAKDK
jgi:hypothetical protein